MGGSTEYTDPLEIVSICARQGCYRDPRDPRGTGGGITMADVCGALASQSEPIAGDMALLIGAQMVNRADEIESWLCHWVAVEANRRGSVPSLEAIGRAVELAMADAMTGKRRNGANRYYRWAVGVLYSKAQEAAGDAIRSLFRNAA